MENSPEWGRFECAAEDSDKVDLLRTDSEVESNLLDE